MEGEVNACEAAESIKTAWVVRDLTKGKDISLSSDTTNKLTTIFANHLLSCRCFTTEILEGFDVQRTIGLSDTVKKYGYLTRAISQYYKSQTREESSKSSSRRLCPHFSEFLKKCEELEKMTVNDLFAIQLMQVRFKDPFLLLINFFFNNKNSFFCVFLRFRMLQKRLPWQLWIFTRQLSLLPPLTLSSWVSNPLIGSFTDWFLFLINFFCFTF